MSKIRVGNKQNSYWNYMWAKHARAFGKAFGNRRRRRHYKQEDKKYLNGDQD
jgi:hypothetical protein